MSGWTEWVTKYRWLVLLVWLSSTIGLRLLAPAWDDVTEDGDFQYLPARCPSVSGQALLDRWFPELATRSHLVGIVSRDSGDPGPLDPLAAYDMARRFHLMSGVAHLGKARRAQDSGDTSAAQAHAAVALDDLGRSLELCQELYDAGVDVESADTAFFDSGPYDPLALCLYDLQFARRILGDDDLAQEELTTSLDIEPRLAELDDAPYPTDYLSLPIDKVWTWRTEGIGDALMDRRGLEAVARLAVLHLDTEFLAVENTTLFAEVRRQLAEVEDWTRDAGVEGLEVGVSGSAAVGSDLLLASVDSVRNTEWVTLLLVTLILVAVYRAPLLVLVPLITIAVSLSAATSILAIATQVDDWSGWNWWSFNVFKTTRIFVVVILFGAGTDYCLFLIARLRENLSDGVPSRNAVSLSLGQVSAALAASAMTTILGLSTMFFAEFGKLSHSGPAIAVALAVGLVACLTLTPAMLATLGPRVFWPFPPRPSAGGDKRRPDGERGLWGFVAELIVRYPGRILLVAVAVMAWPAWHGMAARDHLTYDLLAGLDPQRPSRAGTEILRRHFPIGETGPVIVLAELPGGDDVPPPDERWERLLGMARRLSDRLEKIPGVDYVRSLEAPLGRSNRSVSPADQTLRSLPFVESLFLAKTDDRRETWVTRFDVVLRTDLFSLESTRTLDAVLQELDTFREEDAAWKDASFSVAGTTAAVRDLRMVTTSDTQRIQWLVVVSVFLVLVVILRHPIACLYMILSVVFSFLVTVGLTDWMFAWAYGEAYQGLEWKVPLFLFVILVAVGEDYNVYLASRVFEEQAKHGPVRGLRVGIARTGGIITSCGLIMAGTFISMTEPAWHHMIPSSLPWLKQQLTPEGGTLQGMIQMGFALSTGVLLDTFVVRPILVPAYLALVVRVRESWKRARGAAAHDA